MVYTVAIKYQVPSCARHLASYCSCPSCKQPLPMLTRHQQLIEVHVRRKGQFAAVPFSAHQGLKVSRYHIGAAPYVFAQNKRTFRNV